MILNISCRSKMGETGHLAVLRPCIGKTIDSESIATEYSATCCFIEASSCFPWVEHDQNRGASQIYDLLEYTECIQKIYRLNLQNDSVL